MKQCPTCQESKDASQFYANKARPDGLSSACVACHGLDARQRQAMLRDAALDALGPRCYVCGYGDRRALLFDHVEGGGGAHRKQRASVTFYRAIASGTCTERVQVLCWNCNHIKRIDNNENGKSRPSRTEPVLRPPRDRPNAALPDGQWSRKYGECVNCGTQDKRHFALGMCSPCYFRSRR